jgi:ABC-2 type transport system ATP-binding protein
MQPEHEPIALACRGVSKRYGDVVALSDVSFTVRAGEAVGLLGPNGAGKSTTLGICSGVLEQDAGSVAVFGTDVGDRRARAALGYVPQELALYEDLSGTQNLRFWARMLGVARSDVDRRVAEVAERMKLTDVVDAKVRTYSGGYQRRLNIAVGLLHRPRLLVLDEPTVGIDPEARAALLADLAELRASGVAIVYATHYLDEVERLCDRVVLIDKGTVIADCSVAELRRSGGMLDRLRIAVAGDVDRLASWLRTELGTEATRVVGSDIEVHVASASSALVVVARGIAETGVEVTAIDVSVADLETSYLAMTSGRS